MKSYAIVEKVLTTAPPIPNGETEMREALDKIDHLYHKEIMNIKKFSTLFEVENHLNTIDKRFSHLSYLWGGTAVFLVALLLIQGVLLDSGKIQNMVAGLTMFALTIVGMLVATYFWLNGNNPLLYFNNLNDYISSIKKVISLLSDTELEIRIEKVHGEAKLKIILENSMVVGGSSIKDPRTQHVTGYLDMTAKKQDFLRFATELVKKSEREFKKS